MLVSARSMANMIQLQRNGFHTTDLEAAKFRIEEIMSDPDNRADSIAYVDATEAAGAFLLIMVSMNLVCGMEPAREQSRYQRNE
jgi:hypothetical protein